MPWKKYYLTKQDIFVFQATAVFTDEDLIVGSEAVARDPNLRPDSRVFLDFSDVDEFQISAATIDVLNLREAVRNIRGKHAFLLFSPRGAWNFEKIMRSLPSSEWFRMFSQRAEAYAWLNENLPAEKHIAGRDWEHHTQSGAV